MENENTGDNNIPKMEFLDNNNATAFIYCKDCGKQISRNALTCPFCGCPQKEPSPDNVELNLGYLFISFLIPLIGIILCCVSWNQKDGKARSALIGTLVGMFFTAIVYSIIL